MGRPVSAKEILMHLARQLAGTRNDAVRVSKMPGIALPAIALALHIGIFLALFSGQAHAVKACPEPVSVQQPDGSEATIYLMGDEYLHWNEDAAGFPVVKSVDGLWWVYAREDMGRLMPTSYVVGRADPRSVGLSKPDVARMRAAIQPRPMLQKGTGAQKAPSAGTMRNLVVLVNFSDLAITRSTAAYDSLFNTIGYTFDGAAGSVKDYYNEVSYGTFSVQSTVPAPVTLANGYAYYGANDIYGNDLRPRQMVQQALAALEARGFDFSTMDGDGDGWVDGLTIIHAGGGEEYSGNNANYIWSHAWSMTSTVTYDGVSMRNYHTEPARRGWDSNPATWGITRIGVICHETGHFLGLPDLYDYDYDSRGAGNFCLMAGGSWNGSYGTKPAHMSAYCKSDLAWVTPTLITGSGFFPLSQAETVAQSYKLRGPFASTQYFLVENRQGTGFDSGLPGTQKGMLIWHVDETQPNNDDQTHYMVDLEEASGTQHLALNQNAGEDSDYFRAGNATNFNASTTPNNLSYSGMALGLDIAGVSGTGSSMSFLVNPMTVAIVSPAGGAVLDVGDTYTIAWTVGGAPDSVGIYLSLNGGASFGYTVATGLVGVTTYEWTVPNYPVTTARLKVAAYVDGNVIGSDVMDGDFTIWGGPYRYVSPAGGNVYPYSTPAWAAHSIQNAIDAAVSGDSIMVAAATYASAIVIDKPVYLLGGWEAGFAARDPRTNVTTIQSYGSVVSFLSIASGSPGIEGFTITGGTGTELSLPVLGIYGGGILVNGAPAAIRNNVITGCGYADATGFSGGGGIACWNGSVTISGNEISGCAAQSGGGIYLFQATAAITGNTISGARPNAEFSGMKNGGGIYARQSNVAMAGNIISSNTGYWDGGGIYAKLSPLSTSGDSIYSNEATADGGGIFGDHSSLSIHNTYIRDNVASSTGGGIYHTAAQFDMANSLVAENRTGVMAGGVYADSCWGDWTNNTIDRNVSEHAGGNVLVETAAAPLDVRNNIVTYGSPNGFQATDASDIAFQYNNCFGNTPGNVVAIAPDSTNSSRNPAYADTASMDYYLGVHSGSIDAGDPAGNDPDGSIADQGAFGGPGAVFDAPGYVRNLLAAAMNDTTIGISWDGVPPAGLDYYAVYSDTALDFLPDISNFVGTVEAAVNSFMHHPVDGCRYYRVCVVDDSGHASGYSNGAGACAAGPDLIPPTVAVVYPAGGESFAPGDTVDIRWAAADNRQVDSISIFYSGNSGRDYNLVAHGEPNDSLYRWIAPEIASDSCLVRIVAFDPGKLTGEDVCDGLFAIRGTTGVGDLPAIAFSLKQNYPNPFNPSTTIDYSVAKTSPVEIAIFDVNGRRVKTLFSGIKTQGIYKAVWNGKNDRGTSVASGLYFYRLIAGDFTQIKKMILLR
jgi:M6 family metalloprotease-like protein